MLVHWFLAAIHLLAFALGFWAVLTRGTAFSRLAAGTGKAGRVLLADNFWGICALILLITGGMRAFGGYEKGTDYYLHQPLFHLKMTLFVLILLMELAPMITLIKWRIAKARGGGVRYREGKVVCTHQSRRSAATGADDGCSHRHGTWCDVRVGRPIPFALSEMSDSQS
jgi:putative membrane protein